MADRRAAMRADIVSQAHYVRGAREKVLMDILAEDDLLLRRNYGIEINLQLARAFSLACQLHTELLSGERLEIGSVAPELVSREGLGVVQAHDQRGIDVIEETVEPIAHQDCRMAYKLWALPTVVAWEDQQPSLVCELT